MWHNSNDGKLYTESEIKAMYPNTSFPTPFSIGEPFSVVFDTPSPTVGELEVAYQDGTEIDSKGNRVIKWGVKDMFEDTPEKTKAELEAEYLEAKRKALVPSQLTPRQLRLQLLAIELLDEVEALCSANRAMSIWFEYSLDFQRSHPMIEAMAEQLGLTQDDMDTFFIDASKL